MKPPAAQATEIGTGSGALVIKNESDKNFRIKPGTYTYFQFENITNCNIDAYDVKITGGNVSLTNVNTLSLNGLAIENSTYRAFNIYNKANDLILKDITLNNIGDVAMVFHINKKYDGTADSYSKNIQLINIKANNVGTFFAANGGHTNDGYTGLIKNFKMSGCTITNSPLLSDGVFLGAAEDYEFSNNVIDNVNSQQGNHNGIFHVVGNGKIFDNKCTNHQGNMVRAWLCSFTKDGTVEIYNNVVWNSTRYGAFELQVPPFMKALASFKPATIAKVYNNTAGKLNTGQPKYFEGRLLDLYDTYGIVEVNNNLLFNNVDETIINKMYTLKLTTLTKESDNIYKNTANEAVVNLTNFVSLFNGVGALRK
ncbi:MAG: hypothetical protein EOO47_26925 [Flavobacterium sp.]|nr:MAG: hypothetical protein EOO47_26925 [Flavobacterium sp.]